MSSFEEEVKEIRRELSELAGEVKRLKEKQKPIPEAHPHQHKSAASNYRMLMGMMAVIMVAIMGIMWMIMK